MINGRLTASEAAARLGVKPATLYSYVSRGLLGRERSPRGSTFDPQEVARLARSARNPEGPVPGLMRRRRGPADHEPDEPVFVTGLSLIAGGRLFYRGLDVVELSRRRSFEEVAGWLWTGQWPDPAERWMVRPESVEALQRALGALPEGVLPVERLTVALVTVSVNDRLRHDLNQTGVPVTARQLIAALCDALPLARPGSESARPISERVWAGLSTVALDEARKSVIEAALVLAADHELAPSTMAARVAAAFRADPYAVVMTGLGPASGSWRSGSSGAPSEVETLLVEAASVGAERAIGDRLRRTGEIPHGFGMPLYPDGDPRARELLSRVPEVGSAGRWAVVDAVLNVGLERGFPPPNIDLGLGALSFCAEMATGAGQAILTLAKTAGWLAHAIEEYDRPTRFRSRADYVGPTPEPTAGS